MAEKRGTKDPPADIEIGAHKRATTPAPIEWPELRLNVPLVVDAPTVLPPGRVIPLPPDLPLQRLPSMPLYQIDRELMELVALREELAETTALSMPEIEERAASSSAIDARIAQYMTAARAKTDAIAYTIREMTTRADIESQEAARHAKRSATWKAQATRLKDYVLRFMTGQDPPITRLETPANRLRVQANGGLMPLDVYAPLQVPVAYKRCALRLTYAQTEVLRECAAAIEDKTLEKLLLDATCRAEPDADAIRTALSQSVICPMCNGVLDVINGCDKCGNKGTVPVEIPGARLLDRGKHLRAE